MMKGKVKKTIAAILCAVTTIGSGSFVFADESSQVNSAENDKWYQEAIGFLAYLGIFTGDENGDMKPESPVTRAEIAAIILREMNITATSPYTDTFYDVSGSHWAAETIQTAYDNRIINGFDDGTFAPDDYVTYEQAVKMVVCAINFEAYALPFGGYPDGYLKVANDEDLVKHVSGKIGEPILRRDIAKLVYNSLTAPYLVPSGIKSGGIEYTKNDDVTILSEKRDIYYSEGTIFAAPGKSIDLSVEIKQQQISFEGEIMDSQIENPEQYVADYVRLFYYDPDGKGSDKTALYAVPQSNKIESITINADDIDEITTGYVSGGTTQISYYVDGSTSRTKKVKLVDKPIIVYNDQPFTAANFASLNLKNSDGSVMTFDEFINPDEGSVRAVDFAKDGTYDLLFVESYETSVINAVNPVRLKLEYPVTFGSDITLDTSKDSDLQLKVIRDGEETTLGNLEIGDVVSMRMNANFADSSYTGDKYITIEASSDFISGTVKSVLEDADGYHVTIDGKEYKVVDDEDVYKDLKTMLNMNGKFYLNKFGTIAWVEGGNTGGLSSGESYGWLINVYSDDSGEEVMAKLYSSDGGIEVLPLNSTVDYWAPNAIANEQTSATKIDSLIDNTAEGNRYFLMCSAVDTSEKASIRLCKFRTNSSGKITRLYLAVDSSTVDEKSNAVKVDVRDHKDDNTSGDLFAGKYLIEENVAQMTVPLSFDDISDNDTYGYRLAPFTDFTNAVGDKGLGYNCFFADISNNSPGVTVRMVKGTNKAQTIDEYNTSDDNPVMVISEINESIDSNDETVYILKGYCDGEKVEYTTARNVLVAQVNPPVRLDKETYDTTTIWTKDSDVPLTSVLHVGDICGLDGSAGSVNVVLRMVDTTGLANHILNDGGAKGTVQRTQFRYDEKFSSSRDRVIFGYVTATRSNPITQFDISVDGSTSADDDGDIVDDGSTMVTMGVADMAKPIKLVNISKSGKVTVEKDDIYNYEVEAGDYIFIRRFKNDASREIYVIRFNS